MRDKDSVDNSYAVRRTAQSVHVRGSYVRFTVSRHKQARYFGASLNCRMVMLFTWSISQYDQGPLWSASVGCVVLQSVVDEYTRADWTRPARAVEVIHT